MGRRAITDGQREYVSSQQAEEASFKVFAAFEHAGFRSGDCIGVNAPTHSAKMMRPSPYPCA